MLAQQIKEELNTFKMVSAKHFEVVSEAEANLHKRKWKSTKNPNLTHTSSNESMELLAHFMNTLMYHTVQETFERRVQANQITSLHSTAAFCVAFYFIAPESILGQSMLGKRDQIQESRRDQGSFFFVSWLLQVR
jgi:hypothetical protein